MATALVLYPLSVAAFVMLGAKIGKMINEDARRRTWRASFLILASISLLAIFPAMRLPSYTPCELSAEDITSEAKPVSLAVT